MPHADHNDSGDDASVSSDSDAIESDVDEDEIDESNLGAATYLDDYDRGQAVYADDLQYIAAEVASATFEAPTMGTSILTAIPALEPRRIAESESSSDDDEKIGLDATTGSPSASVMSASKRSNATGKGKEHLHRGGEDSDGSSSPEEMLAEEEEDEGAGASMNGVPMTKHESLEEPLVSTEADINAMRPDDDLVLCGEVKSFIPEEGAVVIQSYHTTSPLNEGSLLCCIVPKESLATGASPIVPSKTAGTRIAASAVPLEKSEVIVLGRIAELFGPLFSPFYVIRYANTILPSLLEASSSVREGGGLSNNGGKRNRKQRSRGQKGKAALASTVTSIGSETDGLTEKCVTDANIVEDLTIVESSIIEGDAAVEPVNNSSFERSEADKRKALYAKIGRVPTCTQVFCVQRCATLIQTDLLKSMSGKGSDASNMFDEEVRRFNCRSSEVFAPLYHTSSLCISHLYCRWVAAKWSIRTTKLSREPKQSENAYSNQSDR